MRAGFQPPSHPRRHRRGLCDVRAGGRRAGARCCIRATAAPASAIRSSADEARHPRRAVHAGAGAASSRAHPRASAVPGRRAAHGQAGRLSRRAGAAFPPRRVGGRFRARDRPDVYARASALWRGDGPARRGGGAAGRAAAGQSHRVTEDLAKASLRQRNAYFSSSDAAFRDRYEASAEWARVASGTIAVDGGWRIYSSGPGIFSRLALRLFKPL